MQLIRYRGYIIETYCAYYKIRLYPDRVYLSMAEVREAIDKMVNPILTKPHTTNATSSGFTLVGMRVDLNNP